MTQAARSLAPVLRGALLGVGQVARRGHLPGWRSRPGVVLVAAADARPDGQGDFLAAYPDARWYGSAETLLAREELDFVDVCTPPALHAPLAAAALARGLHVLCEKPLGRSPDEVEPLAALARKVDRALVTVHNWKHAPALAQVSALVASDAVGAVRRVRWETLRTRPAAAAGDGNWRTDPAQAGGGILVDHGWHALYALRQWLPGSPRRIAARLEKRESADLPVEDTAEVSLEWDGARAEVFLTWAALERRNRVVVEGDLGTIALDGGRIAVAGPDAAERVLEVPPLTEGSHHPEWFCAVARELDAEIRDASRRGANLAEAVFCAEAIARAYASDREGGAAVPLP